LKWWGFIWYEVYSSPVIYRWRELIVSRILGRNWRTTVPGVLYLDNFNPWCFVIKQGIPFIEKIIEELSEQRNNGWHPTTLV
jgi:hypothetical protein